MKIKTILKTAAMAAILLLLVSCGSEDGQLKDPSPDSVLSPESSAAAVSGGFRLVPAALDIAAGRSVALHAEAEGGRDVEWTSSAPSVAAVSGDGAVSALSPGEAIITASAGNAGETCRVTVTEDGPALAYEEDPGPADADGAHEPQDGQGDNSPLMLPDDQDSIDGHMFDDGEYAWQFIIKDGFDSTLHIPASGFSYTASFSVSLDARKGGGDSLLGDYEGTMELETAIDESSFISAMQAAGIPATDMNSAFQIQTVNVSFTLESYDSDRINAAKYAFAPCGTIPVVPLVRIPAMAISSAETSSSGDMGLVIDGDYGYGSMSGASGSIPVVIEVGPNGGAVLYLPKMLSMCGRDSFSGVLARLRIVGFK